jgi:hypothetical protein
MRRLQHRIARMPHHPADVQASLTPVPRMSQVSGSAASPPAVQTMPLALVSVYPHPGGWYSTLAYQGLEPIYTASGAGGAAIPATTRGRWGQLFAAGRP